MGGDRLRHRLKPFRWPWLWLFLWLSAIAMVVVLSLLRLPDMGLPQNGDKFEHLLAYAVLAAGAVQLFCTRPALLGSGVVLILLGIGLEFAQSGLTDHRQRDFGDALANTLGVSLGLATHWTGLRDLLLRLEQALVGRRLGR